MKKSLEYTFEICSIHAMRRHNNWSNWQKKRRFFLLSSQFFKYDPQMWIGIAIGNRFEHWNHTLKRTPTINMNVLFWMNEWVSEWERETERKSENEIGRENDRDRERGLEQLAEFNEIWLVMLNTVATKLGKREKKKSRTQPSNSIRNNSVTQYTGTK